MNIQNQQTLEQEAKLINIIVQSVDKVEMINKLIEEKTRGIFYGNPVDFFKKDTGKLEFGDFFSRQLSEQLKSYTEITARRNLLVHNQGRVDRKYVREIRDTSLTLGQQVGVDSEYLRRALVLFEGLSAVAAERIITNIYKQPLKAGSKVQIVYNAFMRTPWP